MAIPLLKNDKNTLIFRENAIPGNFSGWR